MVLLSKSLLTREHVLYLNVTFHTDTRIRKAFLSIYFDTIGPKTFLQQHNDTTQHNKTKYSNHWSGLDVQLLLQLHLAMGPSQKPPPTPFQSFNF